MWGDNKPVIGICSICGGDVVMPTRPMASPQAYCQTCGAVKKRNLPIIPMERPNTGRGNNIPKLKIYYDESYSGNWDWPGPSEQTR